MVHADAAVAIKSSMNSSSKASGCGDCYQGEIGMRGISAEQHPWTVQKHPRKGMAYLRFRSPTIQSSDSTSKRAVSVVITAWGALRQCRL